LIYVANTNQTFIDIDLRSQYKPNIHRHWFT